LHLLKFIINLFYLSQKAQTIKNYINAGMSPQKMNLGFATYGRTQNVGGDYTREPGVLGRSRL